MAEIAPVLAELRQPRPPVDLPLLAERVDLVFELARQRLSRTPAVAARIAAGVLERSQARCHDLASDGPVGMVHGDLHPGNVLRQAGEVGVLAIDPRPCRGDPAFDAVDWILSDLVDSAGVRDRVEWLADHVAGVSSQRLQAWCQAMAVVIGASMLAARDDDPVGAFLLGLAETVR